MHMFIVEAALLGCNANKALSAGVNSTDSALVIALQVRH